jgi:hypothetical protein
MKTIAALLMGLSVLAAAAPASAADCTVKGWVEGGQGGRPIFECPQS